MKIAIIGNGFDLSHDLPTSFSEFTRIVTTNFSEMVTTSSEIKEWNQLENWLNEYLMEEAVIDSYTDLNKKMNYNVLNELDIFKLKFCNYLDSLSSENVVLNANIQNELENCDYIINFNYTNTLFAYKFKAEVIHIHGTIRDLESIVIGQSAPPGKSIEIIAEINKHFQLYVNKDYKDYYELFDLIFKGVDRLEILNIGFSFGKSDELFNYMLKEEIKKVAKVKFKNFEYKDQDTNTLAATLGIQDIEILNY